MSFLKKIFENSFLQMILLMSVIFIVSTLYIRQCESTNELKQIYSQNQKALMDSLHVVKNKVGEITFEKAVLITDLKNLSTTNNDLYRQVNNLSGQVKRITEFDIEYKLDEIRRLLGELKKSKYAKGTINTDLWKQDFSDGSFNFFIAGHTDAYLDTINCNVEKMESFLDSFKLNLDLVTYTKVDKNGTIYTGVKAAKQTDNLYINLQTYEIDKNISDAWYNYNKVKKRFTVSIGPYIGYGLTQSNTEPSYWFGNYHIGVGLSVGFKIYDF